MKNSREPRFVAGALFYFLTAESGFPHPSTRAVRPSASVDDSAYPIRVVVPAQKFDQSAKVFAGIVLEILLSPATYAHALNSRTSTHPTAKSNAAFSSNCCFAARRGSE
jgi:hypothetical protein